MNSLVVQRHKGGKNSYKNDYDLSLLPLFAPEIGSVLVKETQQEAEKISKTKK